MADLLTHVLFAYILLTASGWISSWIDRRWVVIGMCGSIIPDLVKVGWLLDADTVSALLHAPFSWGAFGTLTGVTLVSGAVAVFFKPGFRTKAYSMLFLGGSSALVLDGLRAYADYYSNFWLYPFLIRPPTPNLYVSSDIRVSVFAVLLAVFVFTVDRIRQPTTETPLTKPEG